MRVDPETHTHQNGMCSYQLSALENQYSIIQNITKEHDILITYIIYRKAVVKQEHCMANLLS
jgi:hypothetical protein